MKTDRRKFLRDSILLGGGVAAAPAAHASLYGTRARGGADDVLQKLSKLNDDVVEEWLTRQIINPGDRWDGGFANAYEIPNVHSTNSFVVRAGSAYASEFSKYYQSQQLEAPLQQAMKCMLHVQHEDGTIDLYSTNFHSTPDTAFLVNYLSPVYVLIKRMNPAGLAVFLADAASFLRRAAKCFLVGGIHTPNHRWVVCSALARVHSFFPDERFVDRIDEWLGEGIDQDPDGQFTEQSVSIYSPTCDTMFITMGRLLQRKELLDVARKNLDMTLYYIQPGGEVLTDASGRQDSGTIGYVDRYYYAYRYFAIKDNNPQYAAVCQLIEDNFPEKISWYVPKLLEDEIFEQPLPTSTALSDQYFKVFSHSGVIRIRRGEMDASVIEKNPTFFSFMKGSAVLQSMRLAAAHFGSRGQFLASKTEVDGEKITLRASDTHGYYQPYPKDQIPGDGDWESMPRANREMSELQTLDYQVEIIERNQKVTVSIKIEGTPDVPVSMELNFREGGDITGAVAHESLDDAFFLEEGYGTYQSGSDTIRFGPGLTLHKWAEIRGMTAKQRGSSVYLTGYTPFQHTLEFS